jgi:hypothetical protein
MFKDFFKKFGVGLVVAVVSGAAAYFAAPEHYASLGAFAGVAATVGLYVSNYLEKLYEKLTPDSPVALQ